MHWALQVDSDTGSPGLPVTSVVGLAGVVGCCLLGLLTWVGPLSVSRQFSDYLLSAPTPRRSSLALLYWGWLLGSGCVVVFLSFAASEHPWSSPNIMTAVSLGLLAATLTSLAVVRQVCHGYNGIKEANTVLTGAALCGTLGAGMIWVSSVPGGFPSSTWLPASGCVVGVICLGIVGAFGFRSLDRMERAAVRAAGDMVSVLSIAVFWMDLSLFFQVVQMRFWAVQTIVRSVKLSGPRWKVLLQADWHRPGRQRLWIALGVTTLSSAFMLWHAGLVSMAAIVLLAGGYCNLAPFARGLRTLHQSPGLRRLIGGSNRQLYLISACSPAVACLVWGGCCTVIAGSPVLGMLMAVGLFFTVVRASLRLLASYGNLVTDTPFGAVPLDTVVSALIGWDIWLVTVILVLLAI